MLHAEPVSHHSGSEHCKPAVPIFLHSLRQHAHLVQVWKAKVLSEQNHCDCRKAEKKTNTCAAAKSLQSCPTVWPQRRQPTHQAPLSLGFSRQEHSGGLPFPSPVHESEKGKWSRSAVPDFVTPWTAAYQAPPSMGFSRQEYWSGAPLPTYHNYFKRIAKHSIRAHIQHCSGLSEKKRIFAFQKLTIYLSKRSIPVKNNL